MGGVWPSIGFASWKSPSLLSKANIKGNICSYFETADFIHMSGGEALPQNFQFLE